MKKKPMHVLVGAPVDIGSEAFIKLCLPLVKAARKDMHATPQQLGQLYAGFVSAAVGALAADVGEALALAWMRQTIDMIEKSDPAIKLQQNH